MPKYKTTADAADAILKNSSNYVFCSSQQKKDPELYLLVLNKSHYRNENLSRLKEIISIIPSQFLESRDFALSACEANFLYFVLHDQWHFAIDTDFIKEAISRNGSIFRLLPESFRELRDFVEIAISIDGTNLFYAAAKYVKNREMVLKAASHCKSDLYCEEEIQWALPVIIDDDLFLPRLIDYANKVVPGLGDHYAADREIIQTIVRNDGANLFYVSDRFKNDSEIVSCALQTYGYSLEFASERLKNDPHIVLSAVKFGGRALEYASERLRNDPHIVLSAVKSDGRALEFASERLRNDFSIVKEAILSNPSAIRYASESLKDNYDLALSAVTKNAIVFKHLSDRLKDNLEIQNASKRYIFNYLIRRSDLKDVTRFSKELVTRIDFIQEYLSLAHRISPRLEVLKIYKDRYDFELDDTSTGIQAVLYNPKNYSYLSPRLRSLPEVAIKVFSEPHKQIKFDVPLEISKNKKVVLTAIKNGYKDAFSNASSGLRSDPDVVKCALEADDLNIQFMSEEYWLDKEMVEKALSGKSASELKSLNTTFLQFCKRTYPQLLPSNLIRS